MKKVKKNTENQPKTNKAEAKETKKAMVSKETIKEETKVSESKKDKKKKAKGDKITNKGDLKPAKETKSKYIYPDDCQDSLDRKKFRSKIRALNKQYKKKLEKDPKNLELNKEYKENVLKFMVTE